MNFKSAKAEGWLQQRLFLLFALLITACSGGRATESATRPTPTSPPGQVVTGTPTIPSPTVVNRTTSGAIQEDELWRGEIHLTGDISLENEATLVIEPGTTVWLAPNSDDQHCCGGDFVDDYTVENDDPTRLETWNQNAIAIEARGGTIYAVGTEREPIVFRPEGDSPSPAQWEGIHMERGSIQHSILMYGGHNVISLWGDLSNQIEIAYNEVRNPLWVGIDSHRDNVWIHHNIVEGGGHQGIAVKGHSIAEFNVVENSQTCLSVETGDKAIVRNNVLVDCGRGIELRGGNGYQIVNNVIGWISEPTGWFYQGTLIYPPFEGTGIQGNVIGENVKIQNNIIYQMPYGVNLRDTPEGDFLLDHNLVNASGDAIFGPRESYAGENILGSDPMFVDWQGLDLHLLAGSPAIDAGASDLKDPDGTASDLGIFGGPEANGWGGFDFLKVFSPPPN